jgi:outer membrane immunogenic protein
MFSVLSTNGKVAFAGLLGIGLVASVTSVQAQDRWSGFHTGLSLGVDIAKDSVSSTASCGNAPCYYNIPANLANFGAAATGSSNLRPGLYGAQVGASKRFGRMVLGLDADLQSFKQSMAVIATAPVVSPAYGPSQMLAGGAGVTTNWLATLRGKAGFTPTENWLVYATGGIALTSMKVANSAGDNVGDIGGPADSFGASSASSMKVGLALGLGTEYAVDRNWSIVADWVHVNFSGINTTATISNPSSSYSGDTLTTSGKVSADLLKLGVNYKF